MINILYCSQCVPKAVKATGEKGKYEVDESTTHDLTLIENIDEPDYDGSANFKMSDNTIVNDSNEYLSHLDKYIP